MCFGRWRISVLANILNVKTPISPVLKLQDAQVFFSRLRPVRILAGLLIITLGLTSCSSMTLEEKTNQAYVDSILKLGCESWNKNPIDAREVSSNFANAANVYNKLHADKKYDPLAMAAINWNFIDVTDETPESEKLVKTLSGFTIIEFCKSGEIVDYGNS